MATTVVSGARITPDRRQREAIEHVHGPMLVIAGAGTGKTAVLIQRIAYLIRTGHAQPNEILALTYTDNAADEMKSRVRAELKDTSTDSLQVSTFHAWCNSLLQRRKANFDVLDDKDLWVYLRRNIRELRLKHFVRAANVSQFLDDLLDFMRRCQDELVRPEDYARYVARLECGEIPLPRVAKSKKQSELRDQEILERCQEIARVFTTVERMLAEKNLGTFGHMITRSFQLLNHDASLLEEERSRLRFLLVDEFQDANFAQIEILTRLAGPPANLFAVGDPDQAIYRFRGASSEAFNLFMKAMPGAKLVLLEKNRRSLSPILRCAFGIVNENPSVFGKKTPGIAFHRTPLESEREREAQEQGSPIPATPVEIVTWSDKVVEAADLAYQLKKKKREQRCSWSDFAVLYRQHNHREELVRELTECGIPFSIEGLDVLDTPEVRDVLGALSSAVNPRDAASLFRVAALPQFAIDPHKLRSGMRAMHRNELDLRLVLEKLPNGPSVLENVNKAHAEVERDGVTATEAIGIVMRQFRIAASVPVSAFLKFVECWQKKPIVETGTASEFIEFIEYFRQARGAIALPTSTEEGVRLLTAHAGKGLEFRHVAIIRGSSTSFPCSYREPLFAMPRELRHSEFSHDDKVLNEQEERRLFYVAMTRARDTLTIFAKQGTGTDQSPTKFLREFLRDPGYKKFWRRRSAVAVQDTLFGEAEKIVAPRSNVAEWLLMDASVSFVTGVSASSIEIYEECPLRFKLEKEWNLPREVAASLQYGAAMHRVLRTYYDVQRFGQRISDDEILEMFRADLASTGIPDRYQYELYLRQGIEQLRQFLELAKIHPVPDVLETERRFELRVGGARLAGRVDRIDRAPADTVTIVDYKTGKPKSQEDADDSLQLSLYALAAKEVWGERAETLVFYNLENNTAVCTTRTESEIEEAKARILDAAERIANCEFDAEPGYHCNLCPYRNLCPATEKIVTLPQKKSASRAN
jgi:DNA helicase-2/ATP-dependent DNA helicase PcrA